MQAASRVVSPVLVAINVTIRESVTHVGPLRTYRCEVDPSQDFSTLLDQINTSLAGQVAGSGTQFGPIVRMWAVQAYIAPSGERAEALVEDWDHIVENGMYIAENQREEQKTDGAIRHPMIGSRFDDIMRREGLVQIWVTQKWQRPEQTRSHILDPSLDISDLITQLGFAGNIQLFTTVGGSQIAVTSWSQIQHGHQYVARRFSAAGEEKGPGGWGGPTHNLL